MKLFRLNKIALTISQNADKFLNGITSNTLDKPKNAFLDFHGKIIATFDQLQIEDDKYLILIEEKFFISLMKHLERYIRLSKARIEKEKYNVYFDLDNDYKIEADEFVIGQAQGQLLITKKDLKNTVSDEVFTLFRLQYRIPLQRVDFQNDFVLNVHEEDFISYTKGCFLGQEFVAKVHNRSKPSWRLVVKAENDCSEEEKQKMTSKIKDPTTGQLLGFVFIKNE